MQTILKKKRESFNIVNLPSEKLHPLSGTICNQCPWEDHLNVSQPPCL